MEVESLQVVMQAAAPVENNVRMSHLWVQEEYVLVLVHPWFLGDGV
jgi:hypothetical protein